jgi:cell wall-associated NlpC family hydrolase
MSLSRASIIAEALTWQGTPFADHQRCRGVGVDCVNLAAGIAEGCGVPIGPLPYYSPQWHLHQQTELLLETLAAMGLVPRAPGDREPGDLLVFRLLPHLPCSHLGLLLTPGTFLHAALRRERLGGRVAREKLRGYWAGCLAAVYLFPGVEQ